MDNNFNSLEELYKRLLPALRTKKLELDRLGYKYIKKEDIWNFLAEEKWKKSEGLTLSEMVDHILNCDNKKLDNYVKKELEKSGDKIEG